MACHTASDRQNSFCRMHSFDIFRRSLKTHQNNSFIPFMRQHRILRVKVYFSCRCPGRCRKSLSNHFAFLQRIYVKVRMKQLIQRFCFDSAYRLFRCDHTFIHQITGNLNRCPCGTFSVTRLKEEQFAVFNGKFHILHIFVMCFQFICDLHEFPVAFRHIFL